MHGKLGEGLAQCVIKKNWTIIGTIFQNSHQSSDIDIWRYLILKTRTVKEYILIKPSVFVRLIRPKNVKYESETDIFIDPNLELLFSLNYS